MDRMNRKFSGQLGQRFVISSIISALIIIVFAITTAIGVRYFLNENIQGQQILDNIDGANTTLYKGLINQETGQRGYSLTKEREFLDPYYEGIHHFSVGKKELLTFAEERPHLRSQAEKVIEAGDYWQKNFGVPLVELARKNIEPTYELLKDGKDALDKFRQASITFTTHIEHERSIVRNKMNSRINIALITLVLSTILVVSLNLILNMKGLKSIILPIIRLNECVTAYAAHDFTKAIPPYKGDDELLALIKNVDVMRAELDESIRILEQKVNFDELTGLYNRRYFNEFLSNGWEQAKKNKENISLILLDIDHYKNFNDTYGHLAGDQCLKRISQILESYNQATFSFAARYGGEEFAILLLKQTGLDALSIAEEIRKSIYDLKIPHSSSLISSYVTASAGVATMTPTDKLSSDTLISLADKALYNSKQTGRNQVTHYFQ